MRGLFIVYIVVRKVNKNISQQSFIKVITVINTGLKYTATSSESRVPYPPVLAKDMYYNMGKGEVK